MRRRLWRTAVGMWAVLCGMAVGEARAGEAVALDQGTVPRHPQQPQLAVDAQGTIHCVYGVGNTIRYCRSTDEGATFSAAVDLPPAQRVALGMRRGPRIAAAGKAICVAVIGGEQGKGRDGDILAFRSTDGGATWTGPSKVNDVAAAAREGLHALASGPQGALCCVWLDLRGQRTELMAAVSHDGGNTWSQNVLVYRSPDGTICECCHPSVAWDEHGGIHVMWRNWLDGARDMYAAVSTDGGKTFGPASKLGSGTWPLEACPMDGGALAVLGGRTMTVWRREREVFLAEGGREERLGEGEQPWITATEAGPYVVWVKKRGDAAYLRQPAGGRPLALAPHAADPVVAVGPGGRGPVACAWEERVGKTVTIRCQVVQEASGRK